MINVILNDIIEIISGGTPKTSEAKYWENGIIGWLSINDFNNDFRKVHVSEKKITEKGLKESNTKLLNVNDIIISARGTVGVLAQIGVPMAFNQSCFGIRGKKNIIDNTYLYYALRNYVENIRKRGQGSVFSTINLNSFKIMEIRIEKDYQLQQKIASVLSALDDKIELNNNINAELEQIAKTLYDYWFVQFDFPNEEGKPYKSSGGKMVYNEVLKRKIPEGWEVKKLDKCIQKIIDYRGRTPKKLGKDWSDNSNDIIALSAKHVKAGRLVNLQNANRVDKNLYEIWMKDKLEYGDILMTSEAPCGEFFYLVGKTEFCLSQRLFAIRSNSNIAHHSYLYFELSSGNGYPQILGKVSGSTVFGIRQDELRTVDVLIPILKLQKDFSCKIETIFQKIRNNDYQNQELSSLRDWLLPMLMNGQVKVAD